MSACSSFGLDEMEREDGRTKVQVEKITRQVLAARLEDDMEREVRGQVQVEKMTR